MRVLRFAAFGLGIGGALAAGSCAAFSGADGSTTADGGPGMQGDAASDSATAAVDSGPGDAAVGDAPCPVAVANPNFVCDNFDNSGTPAYAAFWGTAFSANGSVTSSTTQSVSPPRSLEVGVPATAGNDTFMDLTATMAFATHVAFDVDFLIHVTPPADAGNDYVEILDLSFPSVSTLQKARLAVSGGDIHAFLATTGTTIGSGTDGQGYLDAWHHAHVEFFFDAANGSTSLTVDGTTLPADASGNVGDTMPQPAPTTIQVRIGDSPGSFAASTVYLDNVVITSN